MSAYSTMVRLKLIPIKSKKFEFRNLDYFIRFGLKNDSENPKIECRLYNFLMDCKRSNNLPDQTHLPVPTTIESIFLTPS